MSPGSPCFATINWQLGVGFLLIGLAVLAIVRQFDVRLVLFVTALALGGLAGRVDAVLKKFITTFSDEKFVVPICTAMGFSYVLHLTGCDKHLVRFLVKPLVRVRFLLVPGTILVGFFVNMPVVSQTSTAVSIGPVVIPILQAARIPPAVIGGAILLGNSIGGELFNPGAPELRTTIVESKAAATNLGYTADVYTTEHCVNRIRPLNIVGLVVATGVFWWRGRRREDVGQAFLPADTNEGRQECLPLAAADVPPPEIPINYFKAAIPIFPLVFLYLTAPGIGVFSDWLDPQWLEDRPGQFETRLIGVAMLLGVGLAILAAPREIGHVAESFFKGAGYGFTHIISLIVTANCFGESLKLIGVDALFGGHLASSANLLLPVAGVMALGFAFLCGSGMAATQSLFGFFAGPALAMGIDPAHVGAVVSIAAAAGRTASPVSAVTLMTAKLTEVKPLDLVRQVGPPLLAGIAAMILASMLHVPAVP
jgi:DcuC family C4-dicarboxylate transporter